MARRIGVAIGRRLRHDFQQDSTGIVDQIAEALRDEDAVHVTRSGLFNFIEVVIGQRFFQRNFDSDGRLVFVGNDAGGHGLRLYTFPVQFAIGWMVMMASSGRHAKRTGRSVVPMPRLTYICEPPAANQP